MYENAALHDEDGTWQMIFGVNTLPAYRRRGCAGAVLERVIADARAQGRRGCVLTCKDKLVHYYEKFGFVNEGVSQSTHGGHILGLVGGHVGQVLCLFGQILKKSHVDKLLSPADETPH